VLDPLTAPLFPDQTVRPTVYIARWMLVRGLPGSATLNAVSRAAEQNGMKVTISDLDRRFDELIRSSDFANLAELAGRTWVTRVTLTPAVEGPSGPPDAWKVLQTYRSIVGPQNAAAANVGLDHLMTAATGPVIGGVPYFQGHGIGGAPYFQGHAASEPSVEYGVPGQGG
jgi:hypothetical protein